MKVAIIGSREFLNYQLLKSVLDKHKNKITLVVSGGANGADKLGEKWAKENNIGTQIFKPDWKTYGKRAGFVRNEDIIKNSDLVFAFWDGQSKGTEHSIKLAKKYHKSVLITKFSTKNSSNQSKLFEGIQYDEETDNFIFNFQEDFADDIIQLKFKSFNSKMSTRYNTPIYLAYKKNPESSDLSHYDTFLKRAKTFDLNTFDFDQMINKAIQRFDQIYGLENIDLIVVPNSSSKLNYYLAKKIRDKAGSNTMLVKDILVKNKLENIKVRFDKVSDPYKRKALEKKFAGMTESGFKMKLIPPHYRGIFSNFLVFADDVSRQIFNRISDGTVLVVDDIFTSGITLNEINLLVKSYAPKEVINFVLISGK